MKFMIPTSIRCVETYHPICRLNVATDAFSSVTKLLTPTKVSITITQKGIVFVPTCLTSRK